MISGGTYVFGVLGQVNTMAAPRRNNFKEAKLSLNAVVFGLVI
jgi:hypothetical protein